MVVKKSARPLDLPGIHPGLADRIREAEEAEMQGETPRQLEGPQKITRPSVDATSNERRAQARAVGLVDNKHADDVDPLEELLNAPAFMPGVDLDEVWDTLSERQKIRAGNVERFRLEYETTLRRLRGDWQPPHQIGGRLDARNLGRIAANLRHELDAIGDFLADDARSLLERFIDKTKAILVGACSLLPPLAHRDPADEIDDDEAEAEFLAAKQAYLTVLLAQEALRVAEESHRNALENQKALTSRLGRGRGSRVDNIKMAADVEGRIPPKLEAKSRLDTLLIGFKRLIGAAPEAEVRLTDALTEVFPELSRESLLARMDEREPSLRAARKNISLNERILRLKRADYLPTLSALANYTYYGNGPTRIPERKWMDPTFLWGLQVSVPLWGGGAKWSAYQEALNDRKMADLEGLAEAIGAADIGHEDIPRASPERPAG